MVLWLVVSLENCVLLLPTLSLVAPQMGWRMGPLTPLFPQPPHQHCLKALPQTLSPVNSFLRQTS